MKLTLKAEGFDADFYPFDWRHDLIELGRELNQALKRERAGTVTLGCPQHGRVGRTRRDELRQSGQPQDQPAHHARHAESRIVRTRARIRLAACHVRQARRARYETQPGAAHAPSRRRATRAVPDVAFRGRIREHDLYDHDTWQGDSIAPQQALLSAAKTTQRRLADGDARMRLIAGFDQKTIVDMNFTDTGDIEFFSNREGDGTVPLAFQELEGVATWYVEAEHGGLANNRQVRAAVCDLVKTGTTNVLPDSRPRSRGELPTREAYDPERYADLRVEGLTASEKRALLREFVSAGVDDPTVAQAHPPALDIATNERSS